MPFAMYYYRPTSWIQVLIKKHIGKNEQEDGDYGRQNTMQEFPSFNMADSYENHDNDGEKIGEEA